MNRERMSVAAKTALASGVLGLAMVAIAPAGPIPAFPGAEGFGMYTPGGRGGKVLFVSNLEDYDPDVDKPIPGSLRAAIETEGPRIILFRVAGYIPLKAPLSLRNRPYVTIAGQSAPGDGVCLRNFAVWVEDTHDVVIRYLRSRPGDEVGPVLQQRRSKKKIPPGEEDEEPDGITVLNNASNVVIDHCSTTWGIDQTLSACGTNSGNITVQWCIIAEALASKYYPGGPHSMGSLIGSYNGDITYHHNLYAQCEKRAPGFGGRLLDFRNNVIFNGRGQCAGYPELESHLNYVSNYIKAPNKYVFLVDRGRAKYRIYWEGNVLDGGAAAETNVFGKRILQGNAHLISYAESCNIVSNPYPAPSITMDTAEAAYKKVLADAGANRPVRDATDTRIVEDVRAGRARFIKSQTQVGGWPELKSAALASDSDNDGMPDAWEQAHGLNPKDAADGAMDADGDGYTNIEEWLNATDPRHP